MNGEEWRDRLKAAVDEVKSREGASLNSLSERAGLSRSYLSNLFKEGKDPTISNLLAVCDAVGVTLPYILYGTDLDPDTEDLLRLAQGNPDRRTAILSLLRSTPGEGSLRGDASAPEVVHQE